MSRSFGKHSAAGEPQASRALYSGRSHGGGAPRPRPLPPAADRSGSGADPPGLSLLPAQAV